MNPLINECHFLILSITTIILIVHSFLILLEIREAEEKRERERERKIFDDNMTEIFDMFKVMYYMRDRWILYIPNDIYIYTYVYNNTSHWSSLYVKVCWSMRDGRMGWICMYPFWSNFHASSSHPPSSRH